MDLYTPSYVPSGDEVAVITTNKGEIRVELFGKEAPIAVGNFVELASKGFYEQIKFHALVSELMIQAGDPKTKEYSCDQVHLKSQGSMALFGTGGPGYCIPNEKDTNPKNKHVEGSVAMAIRDEDPNSAGSQFYFCMDDIPRMNTRDTVFGEILDDGLDVVEELDLGDVIEKIEIENMH